MKNPPKEIWLQFYGDGSPAEMLPNDEIESADVSWCATKVFLHDVKYVRAKHPVVPVDALLEFRNRIGTYRNQQEAAGNVDVANVLGRVATDVRALIERHKK